MSLRDLKLRKGLDLKGVGGCSASGESQITGLMPGLLVPVVLLMLEAYISKLFKGHRVGQAMCPTCSVSLFF